MLSAARRALLASFVAGAAFVVACSSSSGIDAPAADDGGTSSGDSGGGGTEAGSEGGSTADAPSDAPKEADAKTDTSTPALCSVYPSVPIAYDGDSLDRYVALAAETHKRAAADCRIAALFANLETFDPIPIDCFTIELREIAGCLDGGFTPIKYDGTAIDVNSDACLPGVKVGIKQAAVVTEKDFSRFMEHLQAAAVVVGYSPGSATALVGQANAKKATVVTSASTSYSNDTCDGGI